VNPIKGKKLTNVRAAGKDENVLLTPPIQLTLEGRGGIHRRRRAGGSDAEDDPACGKRYLTESDRKRASRESPPRTRRELPGLGKKGPERPLRRRRFFSPRHFMRPP
jgi:hypothetical protein